MVVSIRKSRIIHCPSGLLAGSERHVGTSTYLPYFHEYNSQESCVHFATVINMGAGRTPLSTFGGGRSKKKFLFIDTNCSSYDPADPFLAFDVLRKLLGALSSRMGACQYRMSPEEHKLSMHLMTIVEPFVGLSPSRRTTDITHQPTEILDAIVSHLDSKRDLLSLGLTCRRLHAIIFPRHFDFRVIRCKVSSIRVWNHLIEHQSLARNVRRLVVLDERNPEPETVPASIISTNTDFESTDDELGFHVKQERLLVAAMEKMSSLQSFSWACNHSPISIDYIWPTILKHTTVKEIEIHDNLIFSPFKQDEEENEPTDACFDHVCINAACITVVTADVSTAAESQGGDLTIYEACLWLYENPGVFPHLLDTQRLSQP
jgi:hypothetical protein